MSISDNEDLDQKPSAKKTTEDSPSSSSTNNNSRRTQKRGLNNNWSSSDDNDEKVGGIQGRNIVHKNLRLSYEDQVDVSYRRTALLLRGGGGSGSVDEKKNEIIIMPSLVSLSDDFFNNGITPNSNIDNYNDVMDSGDVMEESPEVVSSENNFDSSSNNSSNVAGVPRLRPRSLRDSQRREHAGRALVAMFAENNNSSLNNESGGSSSSVGRPREDWPIGPQGAQVPSHLLYPRLEDDVMVNTGNNSNNNNNRNGGNEEGVATRSGGEQQSTLGGADVFIVYLHQ